MLILFFNTYFILGDTMKKISVYAITKNEENNVIAWYDSMKEADEIIVLDTGSTDNTVELLKKCPKIKVYEQIIKPWRFDEARNISLSFVSEDTDICVCTDLDERFEPNWRQEVEKYWVEGTTRAKYLYNWSFDENGNPGTTFYLNKIHTRNDYEWRHPVHEVLSCLTEEKEIIIPTITLNHYQDFTKPRSSYLPLLELSVEEDGEDDRNVHYLGREYMYYQEWDKAIATLHKHLKLKRATWKDERCASMRYIAFSYLNKNYIEEAIMWYKKAINEAPYLREPKYDLGYLYFQIEDYKNSRKYLKKALTIKDKSYTYINEQNAWNETIYDLLAISCYKLRKYKEAYTYAKKAIGINNKNDRINNNYNAIKKTYLEDKEKEII